MRSLSERPLVDALLRLRRLRREAAERAHTRAGREKQTAEARLASATRQCAEWRAEMPGRERAIVDEISSRPVALVDIDLAHASIRALDAHLRGLDDVCGNCRQEHCDRVAAHRDCAMVRASCVRHERKSERLKELCEVQVRQREAEADELEAEELAAPSHFTSPKICSISE
jgi:hypothetical protein